MFNFFLQRTIPVPNVKFFDVERRIRRFSALFDVIRRFTTSKISFFFKFKIILKIEKI